MQFICLCVCVCVHINIVRAQDKVKGWPGLVEIPTTNKR